MVCCCLLDYFSTNSSLIGTCLEYKGSSPKFVSSSRISSFDLFKSCLFNMYMMSPISYLLINTRGQLLRLFEPMYAYMICTTIPWLTKKVLLLFPGLEFCGLVVPRTSRKLFLHLLQTLVRWEWSEECLHA